MWLIGLLIAIIVAGFVCFLGFESICEINEGSKVRGPIGLASSIFMFFFGGAFAKMFLQEKLNGILICLVGLVISIILFGIYIYLRKHNIE